MRLKVRDPSVATGAETDSDDDDDDDNPDGTDVSLVPVEEFDSLPIEGLNFTEDTVRQPRYLRITTGTSLDLHCSASGYPAPHLVWLKVRSRFKSRSYKNNLQHLFITSGRT